jgi:gamma-glutamyltranspeptidase/glutathione hydrolase
MTTSLDQAFGSRVFVRGFLLNNQMTDFAFVPTGPDGPLANAVQPGKRPRSSMSPTIVTDRDNRLVLTLGARGGSYIIPFVIQSLVGVLDWNLDVQQAIALPRHATFGGNLDLDRSIARIAPALRELGWTVVETELPASSMQGIAVVRRGDAVQLVGGADPRREGEALGD